MQRGSFKDLTIGYTWIDFSEFWKYTSPVLKNVFYMKSTMTEDDCRKMYNDLMTESVLNRMRKIAQEIR